MPMRIGSAVDAKGTRSDPGSLGLHLVVEGRRSIEGGCRRISRTSGMCHNQTPRPYAPACVKCGMAAIRALMYGLP
jgi:hypothetical protein